MILSTTKQELTMPKPLTLTQFVALAAKNLFHKGTIDDITISLEKGDILEWGYDCSVDDIHKIDEMCPTPEAKKVFTDMAESMIVETLSRYHERCISYEGVSFNHLSETDQRIAYAMWMNNIHAPKVLDELKTNILEVANKYHAIIHSDALDKFLDAPYLVTANTDNVYTDQYFKDDCMNYAYSLPRKTLLLIS